MRGYQTPPTPTSYLIASLAPFVLSLKTLGAPSMSYG